MKIVYCLQNSLIEKVLLKNKVINKRSHIVRSKKELSLDYLEKINPDYIMFPHWSYIVPEKIFTKNINAYAFIQLPCLLEEEGLQSRI